MSQNDENRNPNTSGYSTPTGQYIPVSAEPPRIVRLVGVARPAPAADVLPQGWTATEQAYVIAQLHLFLTPDAHD
jgi:hypothetical protein